MFAKLLFCPSKSFHSYFFFFKQLKQIMESIQLFLVFRMCLFFLLIVLNFFLGTNFE